MSKIISSANYAKTNLCRRARSLSTTPRYGAGSLTAASRRRKGIHFLLPAALLASFFLGAQGAILSSEVTTKLTDKVGELQNHLQTLDALLPKKQSGEGAPPRPCLRDLDSNLKALVKQEQNNTRDLAMASVDDVQRECLANMNAILTWAVSNYSKHADDLTGVSLFEGKELTESQRDAILNLLKYFQTLGGKAPTAYKPAKTGRAGRSNSPARGRAGMLIGRKSNKVKYSPEDRALDLLLAIFNSLNISSDGFEWGSVLGTLKSNIRDVYTATHTSKQGGRRLSGGAGIRVADNKDLLTVMIDSAAIINDVIIIPSLNAQVTSRIR